MSINNSSVLGKHDERKGVNDSGTVERRKREKLCSQGQVTQDKGRMFENDNFKDIISKAFTIIYNILNITRSAVQAEPI